jgi:hypothetical protein
LEGVKINKKSELEEFGFKIKLFYSPLPLIASPNLKSLRKRLF